MTFTIRTKHNILENSKLIQLPKWIAEKKTIYSKWSYEVTLETDKAIGMVMLDQDGNHYYGVDAEGFTKRKADIIWVPKSVVKGLSKGNIYHFERV